MEIVNNGIVPVEQGTDEEVPQVMDLHESSRSSMKRDIEESLDLKSDRVGDEEDWDGSEKRKHRSGKPRRQNNTEEGEEWENSERRKGSGDRTENRKRSTGSSRAAGDDEDEYDTRKELRSKQAKKTQEEKTEKKLSSGYQEKETEINRKGRDVSANKGHGAADESEKESSRKSGSKIQAHESSQSKSRSKGNSSHGNDEEKMKDRDFRYTERKESSRDRGRGSRELEKNPKRRWEESELVRKEEDNYVDKLDGKVPDFEHGSARERSSDVRTEPGDSRSRIVDSSGEKSIKFSNVKEKRNDGDELRSRGKREVREEDDKLGFTTREERAGGPRDDKLKTGRDKAGGISKDVEFIPCKPSGRGLGEKIETHRSDPPHGVNDITESRERHVKTDVEGRARTRDRIGREVRNPKRSRSPERGGRRHQESGDYESDNERSISFKEKEREKESYRDDRPKGRDSSWSDRTKDRDFSKDSWKRRHQSSSDKDTAAYGNVDYEHDFDWDTQRRDRERNDNDKLHNYPGYRKIVRGEGAKTSSSYGNANRSSEMIEIRPNAVEYGREESATVFAGKKVEGGQPTDYTSYLPDGRARVDDGYGPGGGPQERYSDEGSSAADQSSGRNSNDMQGEKGRGHMGLVGCNRNGGPISGSGSQPLFVNDQVTENFNRIPMLGTKGSRLGRGGRGRLVGRDGQRVGIQMPMTTGSPFGPLGFPSGPMHALGPNMSPGPGTGPPIGLNVFIPQFPAPNVWQVARGVDMNMLPIPHGLSPVPPGPLPSRFPPNVVTGPNPGMYFNQQIPTRGVSPSMPGPSFNVMGSMGRGSPIDKAPGVWGAPPRISGPPGKAQSRGEQNDYSQNFVDTGKRPQNYIRKLELPTEVEDYPKLRELIQKKNDIVDKSSFPPMYYKCDLREHVLSPEFFGTKFDVILVDPPWEEYVHRAPGVADHMEYWTFEEILNLKIEAIADTPSFIFLWVGDGVGLEQGRQCLRKWGFRRCEDICWVKTNDKNPSGGGSLRHDSGTLFQRTKEHCLMGIKGTVRRSTDGHIIHANIDTDIIVEEEKDPGSTEKPVDMYRIIEHFSLGRRRLELFGEDHNIRPGWVTVGKDISSSYFNAEAYISNFSDENGNVWQGGGGRNPPPGAPHLVETTPLIESLRPKSPPHKNQQMLQQLQQQQQQLLSISLTQNPPALAANQEASSSTTASLVPPPAQWTAPPAAPPDMTMMMMMGVVPPPPENAYGSSGQITAAQHLDFGPL